MIAESGGRVVPFVRRVRVRGFRSIAGCDVTLGPLTVLVGFNAAGKSNFLDVLRFVTEALETTPAQAAAARGGLDTLLHRSPAGQVNSFSVRLYLGLRLPRTGGTVTATYGFEIHRDTEGGLPLVVVGETGEIQLPGGALYLPLDSGGRSARLRLPATAIDPDEPQAVLEAALRAMRFYDLHSTVLRQVDEQPPVRPYLGTAGEHLGPVIGELAREETGKERFDAYLSALVPGALGVDERREGRYSTVQARFRAGDGAGARGDDGPDVEVFLREALSEGTLRAAGTLAALAQPAAFNGRIPLIGIEKPETALHPAGVNALYEALDDAAARTQVIVTSQSSDLLDSDYTRLEHIRVVANVAGVTKIGEVDAAGKSTVEKGLMTISELHRSGQMRPSGATSPPPDGPGTPSQPPGGGVGR